MYRYLLGLKDLPLLRVVLGMKRDDIAAIDEIDEEVSKIALVALVDR